VPAKGLAVTTIDAQIAAAAINHRCSLLTVDRDFESISRHYPLRLG
jgi:predicted nucleic acid-binding protein